MKLRIDERYAQVTIIALCAVAAALGLGFGLLTQDIPTIFGASVGLLCYGGLTLASWYRLRWANVTTVAFSTLLAGIAHIADVQARGQFSVAIFIPPVMALILAGPFAVGLSGVVTFALPALFGGSVANPYVTPIQVVVGALVIAGMLVGRAVLETLIERSTTAEAQARAASDDATAKAAELATRAAELARTNAEQARLIEIINQLELPVVRLADNLLLLPLVGHLDSRRMADISERLLETVATNRSRMVIIDIAGIALIDTQVAQAIERLIASVKLIGADVTLTGIRAEVAQTMTSIGIGLGKVRIARTPQEILSQHYAPPKANN